MLARSRQALPLLPRLRPRQRQAMREPMRRRRPRRSLRSTASSRQEWLVASLRVFACGLFGLLFAQRWLCAHAFVVVACCSRSQPSHSLAFPCAGLVPLPDGVSSVAAADRRASEPSRPGSHRLKGGHRSSRSLRIYNLIKSSQVNQTNQLCLPRSLLSLLVERVCFVSIRALDRARMCIYDSPERRARVQLRRSLARLFVHGSSLLLVCLWIFPCGSFLFNHEFGTLLCFDASPCARLEKDEAEVPNRTPLPVNKCLPNNCAKTTTPPRRTRVGRPQARPIPSASALAP